MKENLMFNKRVVLWENDFNPLYTDDLIFMPCFA